MTEKKIVGQNNDAAKLEAAKQEEYGRMMSWNGYKFFFMFMGRIFGLMLPILYMLTILFPSNYVLGSIPVNRLNGSMTSLNYSLLSSSFPSPNGIVEIAAFPNHSSLSNLTLLGVVVEIVMIIGFLYIMAISIHEEAKANDIAYHKVFGDERYLQMLNERYEQKMDEEYKRIFKVDRKVE